MKNLLNKNIKVMEDVLSQQVGGETVMLDLNGENYFGLDTVGTRILELIREYGDLDKIYETLLDEYDVESEQLKNDLEKLIEKLIEAGLVEISD